MENLETHIATLIAQNFALNGLKYDKKFASDMYEEIILETKGFIIVETLNNKNAKGFRKCYFTYIKHKNKVVILNNTL